MTIKLKSLPKNISATPNNPIGFEAINDDILRLTFGNTQIELHRDGKMSFNTHEASITLSHGDIEFKNTHCQLQLAADGTVLLDGKKVEQYSQENIRIESKQNIYLNSH